MNMREMIALTTTPVQESINFFESKVIRRSASLKDGSEIALEAYRWHPDLTRFPGEEKTKVILFRALSGNKLIGYAEFYLYGDQSGSVEDVHVEPEYRRVGVATAIYDFIESVGLHVEPSKNRMEPDGRAFWKGRSTVREGRLDELQGVKRHLEQGLTSKQAVIAYMQKKGFELLGAGTFGAVFDHPSFAGKYVIKVFSDQNYEYFVDFCRTQPQNPNLPKFFGKTIPLGPHGRMVRMERLYVPANPLDRDVAAVLTLASRAAFDDIDESEAEALVAGYPERFQGLYKTAFELCMISPGGSATIDMIGNVMVRKSGDTLVISDPYDGSDFKM